MTERLRDFISVPVHVHARLGSLYHDSREKKSEAEIHDSLVTLKAAYYYCRRFFGENCLLTDTDHPFHICAATGKSKKEALSPQNLKETIAIMSEGVAERAELVREEFGRQLLTGVEVDIISDQGRLDIKDEVLSELDIVIASLHYGAWRFANEQERITLNEYLRSLLGAVKNPHVDILGHPFFGLQLYHQGAKEVNNWQPLFEAMVNNSVLMEINLTTFNSNHRFAKEDKKSLLKAAKQSGVKFCCSLDFHGFNSYGVEDDKVINFDNVEERFQENLGTNHMAMFLHTARVQAELNKLGIRKEDIINSDPETFKDWLKFRS